MIRITETGAKLAILDGMRQSDEQTLQRLISRLRDKQSELTKIQREAKDIAKSILVTQRQIAAISDEMANLIAYREAA